jgi:plastocyanin
MELYIKRRRRKETMSKTRNWSTSLKAVLLVMPMLAMSVAGIRPAVAAPADQPSGAQTFNATVGHEIFTEEGKKSSWQATRFYPENITVNAGDSIMWKFDSGVEPHTVSFLSGSKMPTLVTPAPQPAGPPKLEVSPVIVYPQGGKSYDGTGVVSSGLVAADIPGPKDYSLSFTKPGTYTFVCLLHAVQLPDGTFIGMQGKVTVQAAGSAYPKTNAQVQAEAAAMMAEDEHEAMEAESEAKMVTTSAGDNGTTVHHVNAGYQIAKPTYTLDYMRFAPSDINISVGDTVEWSSPTPHNFHNVLFGEEPEVFVFEPQAAGPPKVYLNPVVAFPSQQTEHTGSGIYNSGTLVGPEDPPEAGVPSYSLTFSAPGRFEYICAYHYHNGMDGHVVVAARTGGEPGMPSTGGGESALPLLALLAGLLLASAGVGLRMRKVSER